MNSEHNDDSGTPPDAGDTGGVPHPGAGSEAGPPTRARGGGTTSRARPSRKQVLLRLDPLVHDALARWAGEELRSVNAQIEFLLRRALAEAGRLPRGVAAIPRRGRPKGSTTKGRAASGTPEPEE